MSRIDESKKRLEAAIARVQAAVDAKVSEAPAGAIDETPWRARYDALSEVTAEVVAGLDDAIAEIDGILSQASGDGRDG